MDQDEFEEPSFGDLVDLVKRYEESIKAHSAFFEEDSYEQIVLFYQENREFNKALKVVESALEQYAYSPFFYIKKAEILANQKQFDNALDALDKAQSLDPSDINIFLIRADVYLWQGNHAAAMAETAFGLSIAEDDEDKCDLYLEIADIWEDQEKYYEVIDALKSAIKYDPLSEEALNRLWFCTELTENFESSIVFHTELVEISPYSYLAWFNLGHAYAGLNQYEKSLEAFEFVMAIDDTFDAVYICCGDVKYNMGLYDESINFYLDAIKISKPNKELYLKTAETYEQLNDYTKARTYLRKAISVDPYYDEAFFRIGETYRAEENWTKAISHYERAAKIGKENAEYMAALAEAYMSTDQGERAVELFERIFQLEVHSKQSWINLATAYFNIERYHEAFQLLQDAEEKYPNSADLFYIKSIFHLQAGNINEAIVNLERGLLANFDEHTIIFEMDKSLINNTAIIQVIDQYRS